MSSNNRYKSNEGSAFDIIFILGVGVPFAAVACQVSITEVHTSHPGIKFSDYLGFSIS
jgi:uncharacterized membrane protein